MSKIGKYGVFNNRDYVPIHVHDSHSEFDGLADTQKLVMKARQMGFPALSITNHGNTSSWIKFIKYCAMTKDKKDKPIQFAPIKPILGNQVYLCQNHQYKSRQLQPSGSRGNTHLILLAKNWEGYKNLSILTQKSYVDGFYRKPRIDMQMLNKHHSGIIVSSACPASIVNYNLAKGRIKQAEKVVGMFKQIFKEDFFLQIMQHGYDIQTNVIADIFAIAKKTNTPAIVTNDVHYINKQHAQAQQILMCMSTQGCIKDPNRIHHPYKQFYLKSAQQMGNIFGFCPQLLYNTVQIADRVDINDITKNLFGTMRLPQFSVPQQYQTKQKFYGRLHYLKDIAIMGLKQRGWDKSQKHIDRLNLQISDIQVAYESNDYDFATYFLIQYDMMRQAKSRGIITGFGRGSGFASILLHCIGVCYGADPLAQQGMLWQRFLGFDDKQIILEKDFGFQKDFDLSKIDQIQTNDQNELEQGVQENG